MSTVNVKGYEFKLLTIKDSFTRRAILFQNNILESLRKIGIGEDDVNVRLEAVAIKKAPAAVSFYFQERHLYYSYNGCARFVENLYVVSKVVELEIAALLSEQKSVEDFIRDFSEDQDIEKQRTQAREILGVEPDTRDLEVINKKYKQLAKEHHPDMPTGDAVKFKAINKAHKTLLRELT